MATEPETTGGAVSFWQELAEFDATWTRRIHALCTTPWRRTGARLLGRCGGAAGWMLVIVLVATSAEPGAAACARAMLWTGVLNVMVYAAINHFATRPRPFIACPDIEPGDSAYDAYGFPSGHTLHATAFAIVLFAYFPGWALIALVFAAAIGTTRVMLGVHYPTDVLAGALLGVPVASAVLAIIGGVQPV